MKPTVAVLLIIIFSISLKAQTGQSVPELALFDAKMQQIMTSYKIQGGQLAITYKGRLVYSRGFGFADSADQILVQPTSIFRLASISKSITSIGVMKLVENGRLKLDDTVIGPNGILKDPIYQGAIDPRMYTFTVRQLLNHSAGFNYSFTEEPLWKGYDIAIAMGVPPPTHSFELILRWTLQHKSLGFVPGTSAGYSNFGYSLLGLVIENVTGKKYEDYVRDSILLPLGILDMHAGKTLKIDKYPSEVSYYDYDGAPLSTSVFTGIPNSVPAQYGGYDWEIMTPAGGWVASAQDLCKLLAAVDRFSTKPDMLLPATIDTMIENSVQWPAYALGWFVTGDDYWNNGGIQGTATTFESDGAHELNYAILFNTLPEKYTPFYNDFVHLISDNFSSITLWPSHDLFFTGSGITDIKSSTAITIYPNPCTEKITIDNTTADCQFVMYNCLGELVLKKPLFNDHDEISLNVADGMYFYQITDRKKLSIVGKLLIQK